MLHENNIGKKGRTIVPTAEAIFRRSGWGKKHKRWLHLYSIHPPTETPFLPSDEALRALVATLPGVRFHKSERYSDRDLFYVYGVNRNLFTTRAVGAERIMRKNVLQEVALVATATRDTPEHVLDSCEEFCRTLGCISVEWTGIQIIAYTSDSERYESMRVRGGIFWRPLRNLVHTCKLYLPFLFRTAPS